MRIAPYDQIGQQLLDPESTLNNRATGAVVLLLQVDALERRSGGRAQLHRWLQLLVSAIDRSPASLRGIPILLLLTPAAPRAKADPERRRLNDELEDWIANAVEGPGVRVITSSRLAAEYPVERYYDAAGERMADVPYTGAQFIALATSVARHLRALVRPPRKVLVVDCDGVLWLGSCAEDGWQGVAIDGPRLRMQRFLVAQATAGTMVCLCSKNDEADVMTVFERREDMLLERHHLATWRINWKRKSANLIDIAEELQVAPDSIVFIDDSPVECAEVQDACPAVLTLHHATSAVAEFCDRLWALDRAYTTEEDTIRSGSRERVRAREAARAASPTFADFIRSLDLTVRVEAMQRSEIYRMAQLSVRTNQFNSTGVRRSPAELLQLSDRPGWLCLTVHVTDRFEDYGLVGGAILELSGSEHVNVESLFLSCRSLGRGVEHQIVARVGAMALERGLREILLPIVPTPRNQPLQQFAAGLPVGGRAVEPHRIVLHIDAAHAAELSFTPVDTPQNATELPASPDLRAADLPDSPQEDAVLRALATEWQDIAAIERAFAVDTGQDPGPRDGPQSAPDDVEGVLCEMWQGLLGIEACGLHDNFFALGGTSLAAFRMLARIRDAFAVDLDANVLFDTSLTVAMLAVAVRSQRLLEVES
jgi:FkbH-like protein